MGSLSSLGDVKNPCTCIGCQLYSKRALIDETFPFYRATLRYTSSYLADSIGGV